LDLRFRQLLFFQLWREKKVCSAQNRLYSKYRAMCIVECSRLAKFRKFSPNKESRKKRRREGRPKANLLYPTNLADQSGLDIFFYLPADWPSSETQRDIKRQLSFLNFEIKIIPPSIYIYIRHPLGAHIRKYTKIQHCDRAAPVASQTRSMQLACRVSECQGIHFQRLFALVLPSFLSGLVSCGVGVLGVGVGTGDHPYHTDTTPHHTIFHTATATNIHRRRYHHSHQHPHPADRYGIVWYAISWHGKWQWHYFRVAQCCCKHTPAKPAYARRTSGWG
jgi:hypothetical protein